MSGPLRVEIAGEPLRCKHCGADVFFQESAGIDRLILGDLVHLEGWWGHHATIYVCIACGFLHWFFAIDTCRHERTDIGETAGDLADDAIGGLEPGRLEPELVPERVDCLACGQRIPAGASACPACGWSWVTAG
jgi:hypothetical protein